MLYYFSHMAEWWSGQNYRPIFEDSICGPGVGQGMKSSVVLGLGCGLLRSAGPFCTKITYIQLFITIMTIILNLTQGFIISETLIITKFFIV